MKVKEFAKALPLRAKGYARENWGAPFILGFMLLLVVAAISLTTGLDALADEVTVYAYCALVAGAVLQLVCFLKFGEKGGDKD